MDPAVFPWQAPLSVASDRHQPYTIQTIQTIAAQRGLNPFYTEHLARAVLQHIKDLSIGFEGRLTKAQAVVAARKCAELEARLFDNSAYLTSAVVQASQIEVGLITDLIEETIEGSDLDGPSLQEGEDVVEEAKRSLAGLKEEEQDEEDADKCCKPQVRVVEVVENGRHFTRFVFSQEILDRHFGGKDPYAPACAAAEQFPALRLDDSTCSPSSHAGIHKNKDILTALCYSIELAVEIGKYLSAQDILNIYIVSPTFRANIDNYMLSSVRIWINHRCPEAGRVFPFNMYKKHLIPDPAGRTWGQVYSEHAPADLSAEQRDKVRTIPGMKYLQLVLGRDKYVREILAVMAREGHLMPKSMYDTILRLWLLMDVTTTNHRNVILGNKKLWTDQDLYNAQLFFVKLAMHFNDPVFGPANLDLVHLFMGQKTLYRLWQLLLRKRYTTINEIVDLKVRYDYELNNGAWQRCLATDKHVHGVPMHLVGKLHREGYGTMATDAHLGRPDELIPSQAAARGLELERHIRKMMLWGYFDWETGKNIVPTEEQMYLSDEEETLSNMCTNHHWRKKHAMKARWSELSAQEKQDIQEDDEDETLRCQAWGYWGPQDDTDSDLNDYESDAGSEYSINEEIRRGFIPPEQPRDQHSSVPAKDNKQGWVDFVNKVLVGAPPKLDMEWMQRLQYGNEVNDERFDERFDWRGWIKSEGFKPEDFEVNDGEGDMDLSQ